MIRNFIDKNGLSEDFQVTAKSYYVPLAEELRLHQISAKSPCFVGINGCQGSGKSTLSDFIKHYLANEYALSVVVMSLDDFYFSRETRHILATEIHPLFKTRGVPGTHDMAHAKKVLSSLKNGQHHISVPRFNKATDNPAPKSDWDLVLPPVDIVIFEGWCWGVNAQPPAELERPVNEFEQRLDKDGIWRKYANLQLNKYYQPLYEMMDKWVMLKAPSFDHVYEWRLEQEQKLIAKLGTKSNSGTMNEKQIREFIQHYQRLTEHALSTLPQACDHVFELNPHRVITKHIRAESHA